MAPSPIRIAPTFKKPKDLQGSFHVNEDDLGIFDLLDDAEEKRILDVTSHTLPMRNRGETRKAGFSSVQSWKPQRRGSVSTSASLASASSYSSSRAPLRRHLSLSRSKSKCGILLEQQMKNLSL
jgi:hypothetical protein